MSNLNKAFWCGVLLAVGMWAAPASYAACTYSLSPTSHSRGYGATNNSFTVLAQTNCTWTPVSQDSWITIQPGWAGFGTNSVTYAIQANPNTIARTGTVLVAGQTFTIIQDPAPCIYTVSPSGATHGFGGASSSFDITATAGCAWTAINTSVWINLLSPTNGIGGTNTMVYFVPANTTPVWRTGYVAVANKAYEMRQRPAPCIYELSPTNTTRGYPGTNGTVTITITSGNNCSWIVQNTNTWITLSNTSGSGNGSFTYFVSSNSSSIARTGTVTVWDQTFVIAQGGTPCNPSISPTSANPTADVESRTVNLTLAGGCSWGVTNTNNWISVSPMSGSGSAALTIDIGENVNAAGRTGTVSIAGETYTIRQAGAVCTYKLSATNRVHGFNATNNSIAIDTLSICSWSVVNTNSWLTFMATNGVGDSNFTYFIAANTGAPDRTGYVIIGGQQLFVTQHGSGCSVSVSPVNRPHGYSATNKFITVTVGAGCVWNASTTNSWIILATNGGVGSIFGTNELNYSILSNPSSIPRTGYITVEDAVVTLTQSGAPCTNTLVPSIVTNSPLDEFGSVAVFGPAGCTLTITNTNSWITIISGAGDTSGNTNVIYEVATNITGVTRTGNVQIGNENFTIKQSGVSCSYKLSPAQRKHGPGTKIDTLTIVVSNPCPWSVVNTNPWITILTNVSGAGSNLITYAVAANPSPLERVGWLQVEGQFCVLTQQAGGCSYSLSPGSHLHGYGATESSFTINTIDGCPWMAGTTNSWIALTGTTNGNTTSNIDYTVATNTNLTDRIGYIFADSQTFTITQRAASCSISLSPSNRNHGYSATNNTIFVNTASGCSWSIDNTNTWITITNTSGTGTGTVAYAIALNSGATRVGSFLIGEQNFVITQAEYLCTFKFSPAARNHGFGQTNRSIGILAGANCTWTISNTNDWINITSALSGTGNGSFDYIIYPNYGLTSRTALIFMEDEVLTITQSAADGMNIDSLNLGTGGDVTLKLNGGPPGIWQILGSTNLTAWNLIGKVTNTTGKVDFHITPAEATNRFYRAFLP